MYTSDWINLIAGILVGGGTLALAVIAWKTIRKTDKEHRHRQLDEIIGRATDIIECKVRLSPEAEKLFETAENPGWFEVVHLINLLDEFERLKKKGFMSMLAIAITFKSEALNEAMENLINDLQAHVNIGIKQMKTCKDKEDWTLSDDFYTMAQKLKRHKITKLDKSAEKVIDEAIIIKIS